MYFARSKFKVIRLSNPWLLLLLLPLVLFAFVFAGIFLVGSLVLGGIRRSGQIPAARRPDLDSNAQVTSNSNPSVNASVIEAEYRTLP